MSLFSFYGQVTSDLRVVEIHIADKTYKPRKFITVIPTLKHCIPLLSNQGQSVGPFFLLPTVQTQAAGYAYYLELMPCALSLAKRETASHPT